MGWIVGSRDYAPFGIAAMTIVVVLGMLIAVMFWQPKLENASQITTTLFSVLTLALGYVFGKAHR